jgi:hypothetical protein
MAQALSEADVIKMIDSLSNWGRWGADDQLGTINLVRRWWPWGSGSSTTPIWRSSARRARLDQRWEFMLTIAPLRLQNTTGSPVNPIAVF